MTKIKVFNLFCTPQNIKILIIINFLWDTQQLPNIVVMTLTASPDCSQDLMQNRTLQKHIQYTTTVEVAMSSQSKNGTDDKQYTIERSETQQIQLKTFISFGRINCDTT